LTTARDSRVSVLPGDVLGGKFRVERVLGEGGMGVVTAATHLALGQLVALKFMLPQAMEFPDNVARFEREARAAVRLKSEHVARVTDVGRLDNGAPYIVMEYLEGEDLDSVIARGRVPIQTAVDYVLQVCEAVGEAHSLGIVHRDLKPKNLFLTKRLSGKALIKVLDFGISKSLGDTDLNLTSTTQHLGSPNYMSPEQLRSSRNVDHHTDIWALGVILYELLTGRVPFIAETVTQLTAMVLEDPPRPLLALRSDVPLALAYAITKCLEKKPENRFRSVAELALALAPFASAEGAAKAQEVLAPISGRTTSQETLAAPDPSSFRVVGQGSSTNSAWDRTQLATSSRSRRGIVVGATALAIIAGAAALIKLTRHPHNETVVAPQVVPAPPTPAIEVHPAVATTQAAPPPASTAPVIGRPPPSFATVHAKPDAGILIVQSADAGVPSSSSSTRFQLPNTRD